MEQGRELCGNNKASGFALCHAARTLSANLQSPQLDYSTKSQYDLAGWSMSNLLCGASPLCPNACQHP
jgi:hypothetical protein